jgi:HEAT repeat protein
MLGLLRYYREVGKTSVPVICTLLESFKKHVVHREACDTLLALAGPDIRAIIDDLNVDNPMVARDIVYLLRMSHPDRVPPLVKELVFYPDTKVREATLELLLDLDGDEAAPLIATLLDDQDKGIRLRALAALEETAAPAAASKLMTLCFDEEAPARDIDEQVRLFAALGKLAGEAAVSRLEQILRKRSWLAFGKNVANDMKLVATHALEHAGGDRAQTLLRTLARDPDAEIRARAEKALSASTTATPQAEGHE